MKKSAFSLIELLVVVAILGILTVIAVPNYLNSMVKAKFAKAEGDLYSIAHAIESFHMDHNKYPEWTYPDGQHKNPVNLRLTPLTTPVSYLPTIPVDPFLSIWEHPAYVTYDYVDAWSAIHYKKDTLLDISYRCSEWRLASAGPDGKVTFGSSYSYDLSNGLRSVGDIVRTGPATEFPCVPFLVKK